MPLLDFRVKPLPDAVAVKVAQVPPMYHVPALMMQPFDAPPEVTWRVPLPENGVPGEVVGLVLGVEVVVVVVVEVPEPDLGRYLTPVAGQSDVAPSSKFSGVDYPRDDGLPGLVGMKVPVCTLPLTS